MQEAVARSRGGTVGGVAATASGLPPPLSPERQAQGVKFKQHRQSSNEGSVATVREKRGAASVSPGSEGTGKERKGRREFAYRYVSGEPAAPFPQDSSSRRREQEPLKGALLFFRLLLPSTTEQRKELQHTQTAGTQVVFSLSLSRLKCSRGSGGRGITSG